MSNSAFFIDFNWKKLKIILGTQKIEISNNMERMEKKTPKVFLIFGLIYLFYE